MGRTVGSRKPLRITTPAQENKLRAFEDATLVGARLTGTKRTKALNDSVKLIHELGFDAAAKEVKQGKQTAANTFHFIATTRLSSEATRRIAIVAERGARQAGI